MAAIPSPPLSGRKALVVGIANEFSIALTGFVVMEIVPGTEYTGIPSERFPECPGAISRHRSL